MLSRILIGWTIYLLVVSIAWAGPDDPALAKVGDYVIKKSDVERLISYHTPENQKLIQNDSKQLETLVKRMLEVKVLADIARKESFDQKPEIKEQITYVVDDFLSREYLAKVVMKDFAATEADLKEYYQKNQKSLGIPEQVRVRHILVKVDPNTTEDKRRQAKAKAEGLLDRLKKGESFEELAKAESDDQSSRARGGDLGYIIPGQMVKDFEDVAFYSNPGEISDIVETRYGYHIIRVDEHLEARARSYEEAKELIKTRLDKQMRAFKIQQFINQALEEAGVEIYADKIAGAAEKK